MAEKTKQQIASERAEILENMEDDERKLYRGRKTYASLQYEWKDFFEDADGDEVREIILAIIEYDSTGTVPEFNSKMAQRVFKAFIKPALDKSFDEYCYTCHMTRSKGGLGGRTKSINNMIVAMHQELYHKDNYQNVKITKFLSNWEEACADLKSNGGTDSNINYIRELLSELREKCESQYDANHS